MAQSMPIETPMIRNNLSPYWYSIDFAGARAGSLCGTSNSLAAQRAPHRENAMWKFFPRLFGSDQADTLQDQYDPIYGLLYSALDEWLSRNPKLKEDYQAELRARCTTTRRTFSMMSSGKS
jgi:hypothetical protein